ncbi:MAG: citrate (Si)-synthase [Planctomycetota bacterium]
MITDDPSLFDIKTSLLNTGMRGFPVGTCRTSSVNKDTGVHYGGYPISELANQSVESVVYMMLHKQLPSPAEEEAFAQELRNRQALPAGVVELLATLPKDAHPMLWFVTGILYLGMTETTDDWREDGLNLIARVNPLVAAIFRLREGWGDPIAPRDDLDYASNFAHMLGAPDAHERLGDVLRMFHVLHMDHGGGNLSTFTGKAVASGHASIYVSLSAAMGALYGPLHGGANERCLDFVKQVGTAEDAEVERFVRKLLADGGKVFGFGHAVLRNEDPRARVQYRYARKHFADNPLVATALTLREVVPPILQEIPKIQNPYPNVDAISGSLLTAAGLPQSQYYTVLFGWSRVVGIAAQIIDERLVLRDGKGVPIYRPRFIAEGQPERHLES